MPVDFPPKTVFDDLELFHLLSQASSILWNAHSQPLPSKEICQKLSIAVGQLTRNAYKANNAKR